MFYAPSTEKTKTTVNIIFTTFTSVFLLRW